MPNILEIKHGNAVPTDGDLEPYELGYCDSNGFLYIGKQSEEGEKKVEEIKLPTNYYTILYGSDNYITNATTSNYTNLNSSNNRDGVITTTNASTIASLPPTLTGPFCAYKKTFLQKRKDEQGYYNMFQILFEMYPVRGRIWTNAFSFEDNEQGQWGQWKASSFLDYNSFDNYNLSLGYTETANKESGISMYRKDANGILKLGRFYMEDYSGTSSLSLMQISGKNGNSKSAITLRMNWSGEDFRLLTQTSQTGSSYIGDSANPWTGVYALSYNSGNWNGNTIPIARGGTSSTNTVDAANNLKVWGLAGSTAIPSGANLNDYKTFGNYACNSNSYAETLSNCPTNVAFTLKVFNATGTDDNTVTPGNYNYIAQEIKVFNSGVTYFRLLNVYSGKWGDWIDSYNSNHLPNLAYLPGVVGLGQGGTGGQGKLSGRYNLGVSAEIQIGDGASGFPFSYGTLSTRGNLGNTIGQATADNYYWGVDSLANLWAGKQINRATSPTWRRAMMMDTEQRYATLYSGNLTSGSATVTNGGKYAAWIIAAIPASGEDLVFQCAPGGTISSSTQIPSNNHWISYRTSVPSTGNGTITVVSNPSGGSIRFIWGVLRYAV